MVFLLILGALIGVIITVLITPLIEPAVTKFYIKIGISKQSIMEKKPKLELFLLDENGEAMTELYVRPTFIEKEYMKRKKETKFGNGIFIDSFSFIDAFLKQFPAQTGIFPQLKEIPKNMTPISITISNLGEILAQNIRIFLYFPDVCELKEEGSFDVYKRIMPSKTWTGLNIDEENEKMATAWLEDLGNDLTMKRFNKLYVRFPKESKDYTINATVIQNNYPLKEFKFKIHVESNIEKKIVYINEGEDLENGKSY